MYQLSILYRPKWDMIKQGKPKMKQNQLAKDLNELYAEYCNDFLTVERFAAYKGWPLWFAKKVINSGRKINHSQALLNQLYTK